MVCSGSHALLQFMDNPTDHATRRPSRVSVFGPWRRLFTAAMLGLSLLLSAGALAQADPGGETVVSAYQRLVGPGQTLADRTAAAAHLLSRDSREAEQALNSALAAGQDPEAWRAVLLAIASAVEDPREEVALPVYSLMMRLDESLVPEWADAMGRFDRDDKWRRELEEVAEDEGKADTERARAIAALGRFREKSVAGTLIDLTELDQPPAVQEAAFGALATLTGIDSFGADRGAWNQWYREARGLSDTKWHRHLVENFTRRAASGHAKRQQLEDRLLESQRALYRTTSPQDRPAVLAYMLADPLPPIRQLGMDLIQQRLVEGQAFDEPLREALRARLEDPVPEIRQRAALRLRDLADEPAADVVAQRLDEGLEQVAGVLRANLLLMATLPRAGAADPALNMLARPELRAEAAGALAAMYEADLLSRRQAEKARKELRRVMRDQTTPAPAEIILLAAVGDEDDWNRVARWVEHPDSAIKEAAARAWAQSDHSLKLLAERAGDPIIQPIVIAAAIERGNDPWTLTALVPHRPDQAFAVEQWERALVALAGRVEPEAVMKAADALTQRSASPALIESLYTASIDRYADAEQKPATWPELVLRRAQLRLTEGEPALAAADFERLAGENARLTAAQRDARDRGLIRAYLEINADDKAINAIMALLGDGNGGLRAGATDDPIMGQVIDAAEAHAKAGRDKQAIALLDRLRDMLGPKISPSIATRAAVLRAGIERDSFAGSPEESNP
jgi:hypothetical protein